jgi:hypothetical protein
VQANIFWLNTLQHASPHSATTQLQQNFQDVSWALYSETSCVYIYKVQWTWWHRGFLLDRHGSIYFVLWQPLNASSDDCEAHGGKYRDRGQIPHPYISMTLTLMTTHATHHWEISPLQDTPSHASDHTINIGTKQRNSVALGLQTNYIDWADATGRRILVPTFVDRGVSRGQRGGNSKAVNLSFLDRSRYFFFQVAPHLSLQGLSGPRFRPTATQNIW